ncbi:MAG: phosphoadenylyl-sulfate reductase [Verrucomicrobia bacterium]|nr:phosphoadenylyl-sulfate reductase [Verrucomicrobiota bacterium]
MILDSQKIKAPDHNLAGASLPDVSDWSPAERLYWVVVEFPGKIVLTTSFGAQSAALLHLATKIQPDLPIIFIDTGYHFPETLSFADELQARLHLHIKTYRPRLSPQEIESRHGRLWEQGPDGLAKFHEIIRVEPLRRALREHHPQVWIAGLRRSSSESRRKLEILSQQESSLKLLPILEWTDRDVGAYLKENSLPYHPLWKQGYVSIGDRVTTKRLDQVSHPAELRHFGWKRECGIHDQA